MTLQAATPSLILASQSTSRASLLRDAGLAFTTEPAHIDETEIKHSAQAQHLPADDTAALLAQLKARHVARRHPDALVIGADQLLLCRDQRFDKPPDLATARSQLQSLRGQPHTLVTAVVAQRGEVQLWHHIAHPRLTMRSFSDEFLDSYLAHEGDTLLGSVGAYRLEGMGMHLFDHIQGEHAAILGLPMMALLGFLRQFGVVLK